MPKRRKFKVSEATKQARAELMALSAQLNQTKALVAATAGVQLSTNELILDTYREKTGAKEFLRLDEWRALGYKVKKGEKAFRIWGSPILVKKKSKARKYEDDHESSFEHWPMCCLFSEEQVEVFVPQNKSLSDNSPLLKSA